MNEDDKKIVEKIANNPKLLKDFFVSMFAGGNGEYSSEARATMAEIEALTETRRTEIEAEVQAEIQRAINRGSLHRFSGFMDYEP